MFYYDVLCYCCKITFRVYEGTEKYKQFKENGKTTFFCEDCGHKIRIEAILNFMGKINRI